MLHFCRTLAALLLIAEAVSAAAPCVAQAGWVRLPHVARVPEAPEFPDAGRESIREPATLGYLTATLPLQVIPGQPFEMELSVETYPFATSFDSTRVSLEQNAVVTYQPRTISLGLGDRRTIRVEVNETSSGLSEVAASASKLAPLRITINSGFKGTLRSDLGSDVSAGRTHTFTLHFVDQSNQQLKLDAPVEIQLSATEAHFLSETGSWTPTLALRVPKGASSTNLISLRARSSVGSRGKIMALARINVDNVLAHTLVPFTVTPAWWVSLGMSMLGGFLYSFSRTLRDFPRSGRASSRRKFLLLTGLPTLLSGCIAGVVAYLLASWDILGLNIDTSSLRGFIILGFLFSYVGIDAVLDLVQPRNPPATAGAPPAHPDTANPG